MISYHTYVHTLYLSLERFGHIEREAAFNFEDPWDFIFCDIIWYL